MTDPLANPLRALWAEGRTAANGWLAVPSVLSAEAMARAGWDSLTIDLQHGMADYAAMTAMLATIGQTPTTPLVRVPWNDPAAIMRALDAGALGVICPMIETVEDAERFVSACLYPPAGGRSFGPVRARLAYGDGYGAAANGLVLPIAMIETRSALDNLDRIAAVPGLAGLYIGPADLSSALGHPPGFDRREPEMLAVIHRIREAAKAHGLAACIHCGAPAYAAEMAEAGFDLVTMGSDSRFIEAGAAATLTAFRKGAASGA
jgi:4-hydroxy-2-oxoheptanedioate aldolase